MKPIWVVKIKQGEKLLFTTPAYFTREKARDRKMQLEIEKGPSIKVVIHKYEPTATD